jgi:hypothetical protein
MGMNSIIIVHHDLFPDDKRDEDRLSWLTYNDIRSCIYNSSAKFGPFQKIGSVNSHDDLLFYVSGNTGEALTHKTKIDDVTLEYMRFIMEVNGYKVTRKRKKE